HCHGEVVEVGDAALVGRRDLTVEHDLPAKLGQIGEHRPEVPAALVSVTRQQPDATVAVGDDGKAMPVVLHLEEPIVANRRLAARSGTRPSSAAVWQAVAPCWRA